MLPRFTGDVSVLCVCENNLLTTVNTLESNQLWRTAVQFAHPCLMGIEPKLATTAEEGVEPSTIPFVNM